MRRATTTRVWRLAVSVGALVVVLGLDVAAAPARDRTIDTHGPVRYRVDKATLKFAPPAETRGRTVRVGCGKDAWHVLGGGGGDSFAFAPNNFLAESAPFDDGDRNDRADDGWLISAWHADEGPRTLSAWAACAKGRRLRYMHATQPVGPGPTILASSQTCPSKRHLLAGGMTLSGPAVEAYLHSSFPVDLPADADSFRDDRWHVQGYLTGGAQQLDVFAICRKGKMPVYAEEDSNIVLVGNTGGVFPFCQLDQLLTGHGIFVTDSLADAHLVGTRLVGEPPFRWDTTFRNDAGVTKDAIGWTVCLP